jgi:hypothetical protein
VRVPIALATGLAVAVGVALAVAGDGGGRRRAPPATAPAAAHAVGCANAIADTPTEQASRDDVVVGPAVLVGGRNWADEPRTTFTRTRRRDAFVKLPVVLPAGTTMTLSVPTSERRVASLGYTERTRDVRRVADGDATVTFVACPDHRTGWAGGLSLAGPACVRLGVRIAGGRAARPRVAFGRGTCRR